MLERHEELSRFLIPFSFPCSKVIKPNINILCIRILGAFDESRSFLGVLEMTKSPVWFGFECFLGLIVWNFRVFVLSQLCVFGI